MRDTKELLQRARRQFPPPDDFMESLVRRRDRKRRNQRLTAGAVGIAIFAALVWVVTGLAFDRTQTPVVPGESSAAQPSPPVRAVGAVPKTDYLIDLDTGERTPLPKSIVGTKDLTTGHAVSPDGSSLAYVAPGDNGNPQIFVANLDGTAVEQVTNGRGATMPAWSPDGSTIAYIPDDETGEIFVLDLVTGVSTQVMYEPREGWAYAPSFSPDGSSIVYSVGRGTDAPGTWDDVHQVRIVPITGGESVRLVGGHGVDWGHIAAGLAAGHGALSPDGSLLSYACWYPGDISDLCLANADGTEPRVLVGNNIPTGGSWSPDGTRIAYWVWNFRSGQVLVVDVATGEVTYVAGGAYPRWLDDHTLIVEHDYCNLPPHASCPG